MVASFVIYFLILSFLNTERFKKISHFIKYRQLRILSKLLPNYLGGKKNLKKTDSKEYLSGATKGEHKVLYAENLTKAFGNNKTVNNLKLELKNNKCLGLLGVNGAGKSTTVGMLTKDIFFDDGVIYITEKLNDGKKRHIHISESEYLEKIGYCPQEDCLNYFLTGRQLLYILALIRGYSDGKKVADLLLKLFDLEKYADKMCLKYSGGNKRKLNCSIAFLAYSKVILLDEPTSGVDPASRRNFWNILSAYKTTGDTSFLLCSHTMEECEALCDEIGFMKEGKMNVQETLTDLKLKHSMGYSIQVKLKGINQTDANKLDEIKADIKRNIKAEIKNEYEDLVQYQVSNVNTNLGELFHLMEILKSKYENFIDDYIINQNSLEDIFLSVARK